MLPEGIHRCPFCEALIAFVAVMRSRGPCSVDIELKSYGMCMLSILATMTVCP